MSGSPKYSQAELDRQRQEQLQRARQQQAAAEAKRRREAEERERLRWLESCRRQGRQQAEAVMTAIQQQQGHLYAQDAQDLHHRCQQQRDLIQSAIAQSQFRAIAESLEQIESDVFASVGRKRRDEEEQKRRAELEQQQFELEELTRQVAQIPTADGLKFDALGQQQVNQAVQQVQQAISTGNPATVRQPLSQAIAAVKQYRQQVSQRRAEWHRRRAQAEEQQGELNALIAGLQADPVLMRWQGSAIAQLATLVSQGQQAIADEQFESVTTLLAESRQRSQTLIAAANAAQLQADQRDYITDSIAQTLEEMGFSIVYRQPEDCDPASATILGAKTNSGKGISVSIPVQGEVFYDVDGYPKSTVAAVCDEAEQVLTEMHTVLADKFGVQMGELQWQGKDPNRQLRKADQIPSDRQSHRREH